MKIITQLLKILLGISFLFSAYTKIIGPGFFEITLIDQGLAPNRVFAAHFTRFIIGLELVLGILIILPFYARKVLLATLILLSFFTIHLAYLYFLGDDENCGCFGEMISLSPLESIFKNLILIAITLWVFLKTKESPYSKIIIGVFSIITLASMWLLLPIPSAKNLPFQQFTNFEPKKGRVDLSEGENLLALFNLDCEHCQQTATELGKLQRANPDFPSLYILFYKEGNTSVSEFEQITNSSFPYTFISAEQFFEFLGDSPPRIYFLKKGTVQEFWDHDIEQSLIKTFSLNTPNYEQ